MAGNIKQREFIKTIYSYINNKMDNGEAASIKQALANDAFMSEALDGLSQIKQGDLSQHLSGINYMNGKIGKPFKKLIYLLIAVVAVTTALLFFMLNRNNNDKTSVIQNNTIKPKVLIVASDTIDSLKNNNLRLETDSLAQNTLNEQLIEEDNKKATPTIEPVIDLQKKEKSEKKAVQTPSESSNKNTHIKLKSIAPIAPIADIQVEQNSQQSAALSLEIDNLKTDEMPQTGNSELIEDEQSSLVGSKADKSKGQKQDRSFNLPARPVSGSEQYQRYIDNNAKYPNIEGSRKKETVKFQFIISESGKPVNITITKGSNEKAFYDEIVRLICEGPAWEPAVSDGKPIEQVVTYRVIFKP